MFQSLTGSENVGAVLRAAIVDVSRFGREGQGSCEKIEIKFDCGSPRPNGERGWGVRGIAVLPQRALVFPHLERFFSLSWDSMRHASPPSPLAPLPRWGEGNRDRLIFSHLQGEGASARVRAYFYQCLSILLVILLAATKTTAAASLPAAYFHLMEAGCAQVEEALNAPQPPDLAALETRPDWRHFPYAILAPAVLYAKQDSENPRYHDPKMLALAIRIGDLLARESEKGSYEPRLDSDWDTGLWLEAFRLLESDLGEPRRTQWKREIEKNVAPLLVDLKERLDFPWYNSPYIGTSPNHYSLWASLLYSAGRLFGKDEWQQLGAQVMQRYATVEQTIDGYWGEHSRSGPTTGYNHLTFTALANYWEYSQDSTVLPALRRATDFHKYYTYPDGTPVEVINDRNRHWDVDAWGHFGFSHFPDGRRLAEFLTGFFQADKLSMSSLGRLSQDALYYHQGSTEPIPQDLPRYSHQMAVPAGIRKTGPWVVCLSGLISTQAVNSRFYLDRQGNLSVFHEKTGLIVTGANSKRQPELATFSEKLLNQTFHLPLSSRLQMSDERDRLSLSFNTFFSDLYVPEPSEKELAFRFAITGRGTPPEEAQLTLQLCLKAGDTLETALGKKVLLDKERIELQPVEIGEWIRHHGWTMKVDPAARLVWPVYPHNPYADGPETSLEFAVGALSVPLKFKAQPGHYVRPGEQEIAFTVTVP